MSISAVITHVQPEAEMAPRLACARALAERFGARLIGLGAEMIPPLAFDNGFYAVDAEWVIAMRQSIEEQLAVAHKVFERETATLDPDDRQWLCGVDSPTPTLAAASRAADLIVVGGGPRRSHSPYRDVSSAELAIIAGRPVLVAPPTAPTLAGNAVVVAWKDTREARRALSDALPFLETAQKVLILEVCEGEEVEDARVRTDDVAAAVRRRGIAVEAKVVAADRPSVSARLVEEARAFGSDLIVLGCYGHTRMGEWVFGGVTRDLLAQDEIYLLLSH